MVMYDYKKIWLLAGGDCGLILHYFSQVVNKVGDYTLLIGDDFMLNPGIVVGNTAGLPTKELAEYIGLCSLRPYSDLEFQGITGLTLEMFPDYIPQDVVHRCRWVTLQGKNLIFTKEQQRFNQLKEITC